MKSSKVFLRLVCILLCLSFVLSLISCNPNSDDGLFESIFEELGGDREALPIYELFALVVSAECSSVLYDKVSAFSAEINRRTETEVRILYDYESLPQKEKMCVILIGNTVYSESKRFLHGFSVNDYAYGMADGYIAIGGITEQSTLLAIDRFTESVLKYSTPDLFVGENFAYTYKSEGQVAYTVNGFQLYDYSIVYPSGDSYLLALAQSVADRICKNTGFMLNVSAESELDARARSICIGRTERAGTLDTPIGVGEAAVLPYDTGISLLSDSEFGVSRICEELLNALYTNKSLSISQRISYYFSESELSFARLGFFADSLQLGETVAVYQYIATGQPDIVEITGLDAKYVRNIADNLISNYAFVQTGGGRYFLVRKAQISLVESSVYSEGGISSYKNVFFHRDLNERFSLLDIDMRGSATDGEIVAFADTLDVSERMILLCDASSEQRSKLANALGGIKAISGDIFASRDRISLRKSSSTSESLFLDESFELLLYGQ